MEGCGRNLVAKDRSKWRDLVNSDINIWVVGEEGVILSSWVAISFSREILLHGASSIFFYISFATFVSKQQG